MPTEEALTQYKTDAWKGESTAAIYARQMHENRGTNRLKNQVEVSLCAANVTGTKVLDVGIGTGRASLPLARAGFEITGIDVSRAMLDRCRLEAGDTPIELIEGELTALPVADEQFDSLISLNVAVHFPNWRDAVKEWARVVKPGGRLVFDLHSLDHLETVAAFRGCASEELLTPEEREDAGWYVQRASAREVAQAASDAGLSVVKLVPYAALLGGSNVNYWLLDSRLYGYLGDRALSWMAIDERLFAFATFIEETIVSRLSTHSTGRFMAVLEKRSDAAQTSRTVAYQDDVARVFSEGATLASLRAVIGSEVDAWSASLRAHLEYSLNRTLLSMMLSSPAAASLRRLVGELAGADLAEELYDAHRRQRVDESVYRTVQTWYKELADPKLFEYGGVDLGPSLEYDLMRELLDVEFFGGKAAAR